MTECQNVTNVFCCLFAVKSKKGFCTKNLHDVEQKEVEYMEDPNSIRNSITSITTSWYETRFSFLVFAFL